MTFGVGFARLSNIFWAYQPVSHTDFGEHDEFRTLFARFSRHNRLNNGGDSVRLWSLILNIKQVLRDGVEGDFAELGVWRGNTAAVLAHFALAAGRTVYLFDTFKGFDQRDIKGVDKQVRPSFDNTSIGMVQSVVGPAWSACRAVPGYFPDSVEPEHRAKNFAVVSLDCDLYEPMRAGLEFFYQRMARGGLLLVHDYANPHWEGPRRAVDEFCMAVREQPIVMADLAGSVFIRRTQ
jgi:hypothetical protein